MSFNENGPLLAQRAAMTSANLGAGLTNPSTHCDFTTFNYLSEIFSQGFEDQNRWRLQVQPNAGLGCKFTLTIEPLRKEVQGGYDRRRQPGELFRIVTFSLNR